MKAHTDQKKNMYSLIRFSTDAQQWGTSLVRQIERAREEATRRGWEFNEELTLQDLGVSAFKGNNFDRKYALGKFIDASKQGLLLPNPCLCVENLDRFSRDILDNADQELWSLVKRGVDVLILSNGLHLTKGDENDVSKRAIVLFEFDRSGKESQRKSDLVNAAFKQKYDLASNGQKVALGNWVPKWVTFIGPKKGNGKFILNEKAAIIHQIVSDYISGKSMLAIAETLRAKKTPCLGKHGKKWTQGQIRHILTSEALIGQLTVKGQVFKNYFPAVIDTNEATSLEATLKQNKTRKGGSSNVVNLFRNRVFCSACGGSVQSVSCSGKDKYWYRCSNRQYHDCDVKSMIPIRLFEESFFLDYLNTTPGTLIRSQDQTLRDEMNRIASQLTLKQNQLAQIEKDYTAEPSKMLAKIMGSTESDIEHLTQQLRDLEAKQSSAINAPGITTKIKKILTGGNNDDLRKVVSHVKHSVTLPENRSTLLTLLPTLVNKIVVNLTDRTYKVELANGSTSGSNAILPH